MPTDESNGDNTPEQTVRDLADQYPKELRLALDALGGGGELRYALAMVLLEESLELPQLVERVSADRDEIEDALSALQTGGIVKHYVGDRIGDQETGDYEVTEFGEQLLDGIYRAGDPTTEIPAVKRELEDE